MSAVFYLYRMGILEYVARTSRRVARVKGEEHEVKAFLSRRLLVVAALVAPFVVALSVAVPAQAALVRGRYASARLGAGILHGPGTGIALAITVLALMALAIVVERRGTRQPATVAAPVKLPVRGDASAESERKAA